MQSDLSFLKSQNDLKQVTPPPQFVSEFVHGKRVLPQDTPFPGLLDIHKAPYGIEIMDCFSPHSPVNHVALMKGVQLGATTLAENVIGYFMGPCPAPIMILSATDDAIKGWGKLRLEPLIDSLGLRDSLHLSNASYNAKSRASGDTSEMKNFAGGYIVLGSMQSASKMRSYPIRVLIRDEIDGAPKNLITGEGNALSVSEGRTNSWGVKKKIFDLSTPTVSGDSPIEAQYEKGDKRKFEVPCPHCGGRQFLEFGSEKEGFGLRFEYNESGQLTNVTYECKHCHEQIQNYEKTGMLEAGQWVATAKCDPQFRSYHLSSLYSPVGMLSWFDLGKKYLEAKKDPDGMRAFVNLYLGEPYKEKGSRPKIENVIELRGDYQRGTIPDGVLFLTMAIDVQSGSEKDPGNPPRLECEIRGHGRMWRSSSINYHVFEGDIKSIGSGAWLKLTEFVNKGGLKFETKNGRKIAVRIIFIDSGDGNNTEIVYNFCSLWGSTYPIKGYNTLNKNLQKDGDTIGRTNFTKFKAKKVNESTTLIEISTNFYKTTIYNNLNNSYVHKLSQSEYLGEEFRQKSLPPGYSDFPIDYPEKYFKMLTAEERRADGSFHNPGGKRNEALDLAVYNSAAADMLLDQLVLKVRLEHKARGGSQKEFDLINTAMILDLIEAGRI